MTNISPASILLRSILGGVLTLLLAAIAAGADPKEARVTVVIHEVKLVPEDAQPREAAVDDKVTDDTAVRTGDASRSELTFEDLTITRLTSNSIFTFNKAGRSVRLNSGAMLLRVPKDSGGANMKTDACSVAVTGTTVILESVNGRNRLAVLEGNARMWLNKYPKQSKSIRGGQLLDVPSGAKKMPEPIDIDIDKLMLEHPLITDFPPLPNLSMITGGRGGAGGKSTANPSGPISAPNSGPGVSTGPGPVYTGGGNLPTGNGPSNDTNPKDGNYPKDGDHPKNGDHPKDGDHPKKHHPPRGDYPKGGNPPRGGNYPPGGNQNGGGVKPPRRGTGKHPVATPPPTPPPQILYRNQGGKPHPTPTPRPRKGRRGI